MKRSYKKVPYLPSYPSLQGILIFPSACQSRPLLEANAQELSLTIEGKPIPKARARTVRRGNFIATFDPQEKEKLKFRQKLNEGLEKIGRIDFKASDSQLETRYCVNLIFDMEICDSGSNAQRNAKLWGLVFHLGRPDLDNLEKFVLDCANGILFPDDSQIIALSSRKRYAEIPKTIIKITAMQKSHLHKSAEKIITLFRPDEFICLIKDMRDLIELTDDTREICQGERINSFFELVANILSKMMRDHGKAFSKISKVSYELTEEEIRQRKGVLYGTTDEG